MPVTWSVFTARRIMKYPIGILCLVLFGSCSSESEPVPEEIENPVPQYTITLVDSFGVETGDSIHMIGSINDFTHSSCGSILVLDRAAQVIHDFSSERGSRIYCNGGEGPGEFLYPLSLCALENGNFLVADEMKQEIMEYSSGGEYIGSFYYSGGYVPYSMYPVDSVSIQADLLAFDFDSEIPQFVYTLCAIHSSDVEVSQEYYKLQWDWTSADFYRDIELLDFAGSSSGMLFLVPDVTEYRIAVFSFQGELINEIEGSMNRVRKSEEQIQEEIEEFEEWAQQDQAYMGGYQPSEYETIISIAGIDANGNLWVQRHESPDSYKFDIWSYSGELTARAYFPWNPELQELEFHVDECGLLGANVNSEEYPRVYCFAVENE